MAILRLLAVVLVLVVPGPSPAAAADSSVGEGTLAAAASAPPPRELATETFGGGRRLVVGTVRASMPESLRGSKMLLVLTLGCGADGIRNTQNVARGTAVTMTPRLLTGDARTCSLWAQSVDLGGSPDQELVVSGELRAGPEVAGARGYSPGDQPVRITAGQAVEVVPVTWTVPAGAPLVAVVGDVKTTTCTIVGGSRENGSPYLCEGHVDPTGSFLRVSVMVGFPESSCPVVPVAVRDVFVDPVRHHVMTYQDGVLPVLRHCGPTVRVAVVVRVLSGSDVVVHAQGTTTAVMSALRPRTAVHAEVGSTRDLAQGGRS
ncbi:MAG: hypothetical protein JWN54_2821 [Mycobacterium sp.]|nr:hypothetical protein [Mycobacterium sp.]